MNIQLILGYTQVISVPSSITFRTKDMMQNFIRPLIIEVIVIRTRRK